ncbi:MAG: MBL fold metallo-hydrolase [Rhizobiaceae bacterium]|nr:MBL fold metallo-hydrolase [Rhizobiaceae bacterium]
MHLESVDGCDVLVLVDNVTDILSTVPVSVTNEAQNVFRAGARELSGRCLCCAQFGLSLAITTRRGTQEHTLLFDTGPEGYTFGRNGVRLGVDFSSIDAIVFSHGHWDHVGGIEQALDMIREANGGKSIPLHVNDGMFVRRGMKTPDGNILPFGEVPSKEALRRAGGDVISNDEPQLLLNRMVYLSGEIPRVTPYEKGFPPHVKDMGNGWEPDPLIMDERYVAVHVRGKGIIVFSACSHAGIVNVLKDAQERFDPVPLYGVMGGFHLSGAANEAIITQTIADLRAFNIRRFAPGHCTGWRAVYQLVDAFGEAQVVPSAVGQLHEF